MRLSYGVAGAAICAALVGCGGTVQESGTSEGAGGTAGDGGLGGSAGQPSKGGSGGSAGQPSTGGSAGGGVAGAGGTIADGGNVISCGSWSEFPCPTGMFCDFPADNPCGAADGAGVCVPSPMCPDPGGNGACGCDGKYYLSECSAQAAGTDVTGGTECFDGGTAKACGGKAGLKCAPDEWCDYAEGNCGAWDNTGTCQKRPNACPDYCPGVCGCDSQFYCNDCEAHANGVDDAPSNSSCKEPGSEQYSAQAWSGGLDHVLIYKADWARNVCLMIHLAAPHQPVPGLSTPDGWGLANASISNNADDCSGGSATGDIVSTQTVTGAVAFGFGDGGYMPCTIDVHANLVFPSGPSWVYPNEQMNADGVVVDGGCW